MLIKQIFEVILNKSIKQNNKFIQIQKSSRQNTLKTGPKEKVTDFQSNAYLL